MGCLSSSGIIPCESEQFTISVGDCAICSTHDFKTFDEAPPNAEYFFDLKFDKTACFLLVDKVLKSESIFSVRLKARY